MFTLDIMNPYYFENENDYPVTVNSDRNVAMNINAGKQKNFMFPSLHESILINFDFS